MNYIIIDLEWNQAVNNDEVVSDEMGNKLYGEIIQIGAIKTTSRFRVCDELKLNVKPKYYKVIHRKVRQITGINQDDLKKGESFSDAIDTLRAWCGDDFAFLTWGPDDIRILRRNIEIYGGDSSWIDTWFNLQSIYNMQTDSDGSQKSLSAAMEHFQIVPDRKMHDALNDAYYTALVAKKLDVKRGIAELAKAESMRPIINEDRPLLCEMYAGFKLRREVFRDREASTVKCPECRKVCADMRKWITERECKYITLASCPEHGKFAARLCLTKSNSQYTAVKYVYTAGGGAEAFYEEKEKKLQIRKKRRSHKAQTGTGGVKRNGKQQTQKKMGR